MLWYAVSVLALSISALVVSAIALGLCVQACRVVARGAPEALRAYVDQLSESVRRVEAIAEAHDGKLVEWRTEMQGLYESVEGMLDSVETKRRRTAAAASRMNGAQEQQPTSRADWDQVARNRGLL